MDSSRNPVSVARRPKELMRAIIDDQPDDSLYDDILRKLAFKRMVDRGLADAERGEAISTEALKRRIQSWQS